MGIGILLVWVAAPGAPDGQLQLTLLDTNTDQVLGEAILIQSPAARYMLINGCPSSLRLSESLGRRLPFFHRQLDYVIVSGPEEGKLDGMPRVVEQYQPREVLWAGQRSASYAARRLREVLKTEQVEITAAEQG